MTDTLASLPSLGLITKYIAALTAGDHDAMHALRSADFVLDWVHGDAFATQPLTQDETSQFWPAWFAAFPDMDYEITRTIAAEEVIVIQWIFTGTQANILGPPVFDPPLPPTGKTIRIRGVSIYDLDSGLIQKETMYIDLATLWVELGVS